MPKGDKRMRREHNYVREVMEYAAKHGVQPGKVEQLGVYHDDWCGIYKGERCNCNPEVRPLPGAGTPKQP